MQISAMNILSKNEEASYREVKGSFKHQDIDNSDKLFALSASELKKLVLARGLCTKAIILGVILCWLVIPILLIIVGLITRVKFTKFIDRWRRLCARYAREELGDEKLADELAVLDV
jgi:hypothetical protein